MQRGVFMVACRPAHREPGLCRAVVLRSRALFGRVERRSPVRGQRSSDDEPEMTGPRSIPIQPLFRLRCRPGQRSGTLI